MSRTHAARVRETLAAEYTAMAAESPELLNLHGSTDLAINHLTGLSIHNGHYFAYIPETAPAEKLGLLVFLHGNAGNFRLMIWRWRQLAETLRVAVIAPSYGFGFWGKDSPKVVDRAVEDAISRWPQIMPDQGLWLAGLSDGGNGVTRAGMVRPWNGMVYLSATMRPKELASKEFTDRWKGRPVLVLNGQKDHNVWPGSVRKAVEVLKIGGVDVSHECYDSEDHFMTFGAARVVDERIQRWISANRP
jgi:pimeloyl-ACP methyl ester carboxylesterase